MKKLVTIILTALSLILILDSMQIGQALMMFLLAGVIPGTDTAISGATALSLFAGLSGFTLARMVRKNLSTPVTKKSNLQNA